MRTLLKRAVLIAVLILSLPFYARATDIPIAPTGPVFKLSSLVWGTSGPNGFNNNFFFVPQNVNASVCVFVYNNNPTSPHTFSASITITGDPANITPSDGTWQAANASSFTITAAPSSSQGLGATTNGVAKVNISFSGSTVQAGSPDTANVVITQNPNGSCFSGNAFAAGVPNTTSSFVPIQSISDSLSQAFYASAGPVNPAGNILGVNVNGGLHTVYFDRVVIDSSATGTVQLNLIANVGVGCPTQSAANQKILSAVTTTATVIVGTCVTTQPTLATTQTISFPVLASTPYTIDLRGIIAPGGTTNGIQIVGTITGTVNVAIFYYEK